MSKLDVSLLLDSVNNGDPGAYNQLLRVVHRELRSMAARQLGGERENHTLQATEIVNEAWMRLAGGSPRWENRAHFFCAAAEAMKRILIDHARSKQAAKRGKAENVVTLGELVAGTPEANLDVIALGQALDALAHEGTRLRQVVEMRFFVGMSVEEVASVLGISVATVKRDWAYAKAWLFDYLR